MHAHTCTLVQPQALETLAAKVAGEETQSDGPEKRTMTLDVCACTCCQCLHCRAVTYPKYTHARALTHSRTHALTHSRTHTHTHAHTCTHTHTHALPHVCMRMQEALTLIQRHERARQGRVRAKLMMERGA